MNRFARKSLCLGIAAAALASCSEMPSHVSLGNTAAVEGSTGAFPACAVSVTFSGTPKPLMEREAAQFTANFPAFYKWRIDGLTLQEYRLTELAMCLCADYKFSLEDVAGFERSIRRNNRFNTVRAAGAPYSRGSLEFQTPANINNVKSYYFLSFPERSPECLFVQGARFSDAAPERAMAFLKSTEHSNQP